MSMFPLLVLDASAALALILAEEEGSKTAEAITDIAERNGQIFVPDLFWYELGNGLLSAERRDRITTEEASTALILFARLPIVNHPTADPRALEELLKLARIHQLTAYDASYLELTLRHKASLLTFDDHLQKLKSKYDCIL